MEELPDLDRLSVAAKVERAVHRRRARRAEYVGPGGAREGRAAVDRRRAGVGVGARGERDGPGGPGRRRVDRQSGAGPGDRA